MNICECGCGQEFDRVPKKGAPIRFIPGHQFRTPANQAAYIAGKARQRILPPPDYDATGFCLCGCGQMTAIAKYFREGVQFAGYAKRYIRGHNTTHPPGRSGPYNPSYKEGKTRTGDGYVLVLAPGHPNADKHGYMREHRLVMEKKLGRYLLRTEHVHHINGIRDDNREENLVALTVAEHHRLHAENVSDETRAKLSESTTKAWAEGRRVFSH